MITALLGLLSAAPALFDAGRDIVAAVSGEPVPAEVKTPDQLASYVDANMSEDQKSEILTRLIDARVRLQEEDTKRFLAMADDSVEELRASARPEIALKAMDVIAVFAWTFRLMIVAAVLDYALRFGFSLGKVSFPMEKTLMGAIADVSPAAEVIWAPLLASFWACVEVIKKYMGCRERDKAHEFELQAGRPLNSTQATIEAAGTGIAGVIRAWKGK